MAREDVETFNELDYRQEYKDLSLRSKFGDLTAPTC